VPEPTESGTIVHEVPPCSEPAAVHPVAGGLPEITLDCLFGPQRVRLSDLRGTPTVLNIWAQWCGPCREEAPYLAELSRKAGGTLRMIGIDYADPQPGKAQVFAAEQQWRYEHLKDQDKQLGPVFKLAGPPATVFVGADGVVKEVHRGPFTSYQQLATTVRDKLGVPL
jgi:cytochrome c biogenesis protein CcmG, thiol:disulfide interchange protein DsbE